MSTNPSSSRVSLLFSYIVILLALHVSRLSPISCVFFTNQSINRTLSTPSVFRPPLFVSFRFFSLSLFFFRFICILLREQLIISPRLITFVLSLLITHSLTHSSTPSSNPSARHWAEPFSQSRSIYQSVTITQSSLVQLTCIPSHLIQLLCRSLLLPALWSLLVFQPLHLSLQHPCCFLLSTFLCMLVCSPVISFRDNNNTDAWPLLMQQEQQQLVILCWNTHITAAVKYKDAAAGVRRAASSCCHYPESRMNKQAQLRSSFMVHFCCFSACFLFSCCHIACSFPLSRRLLQLYYHRYQLTVLP